jgi:hypothetical protein
VFEGDFELAHRHPIGIVWIGDPHGRDQGGPELVSLHQPPTDQLDQLVVGPHRAGEQP